MRRPITAAFAAVIVIVTTIAVSSDTITVFGPRTYTRNTGKPVSVKDIFTITDSSARYTVRVLNHGVTSGTIAINGREVFGASDFEAPGRDDGERRDRRQGEDEEKEQGRGNSRASRESEQPVSRLEAPVSLRRGSNRIEIELRGKPGTSLTVEVVGVPTDATPPAISAIATPRPNANGWNRTPVTVKFECSDAGSGIATCPDPIVVNTDGGGQLASGTAVDRAGNSATASLTLNVDSTPPSLAVALDGVTTSAGVFKGSVTARFTCLDSGSGVASCPADQVVAAPGADQTVKGSVTDRAGNATSVTSELFALQTSVPTITVSLSPLSEVNGWHTSPVTAHFTCTPDVVPIASCSADQVIAAEGANQTVTGTVRDTAGSTASVTSAPFKIDLSAPIVSVTLTPPPNANGWHNTPVRARFTCSDSAAGMAVCPPDQVLGSEGANQPVTGIAVDRAGRTASASAVIHLDATPPILSFSAPALGAIVYQPTVTATGAASDALSGLTGVTCGGAAATLGATTVGCPVTLERGPNSIPMVATDRAGNTQTVWLGLNYTRIPVVQITTPTPLSYVNIGPTTVSGTVDDPTAEVSVNGVPAPTANGNFSIALPIAEGPNIITTRALTAEGAVGTASLEVTLDTTPPRVTVTSPPDQFVTTDASISVAGIVNDIVVGTVNDQQAQVTVNGASAQVANRTFLATSVALAMGPNVIRAVARDRVGNAGTTEIVVTRQAPPPARIQLISGNNQSGVIGGLLSAPLVVAVTDAAGPVPGKQVIFKVTQNDGHVAAGGTPAPTVIATTDAQGQAQVRWTLGHRAGAGGNVAEAYAVGFDGTAIFTATGTQGAAGKVVVDTGNDQIGAIGQALPKPFIAVVVDDGNNRLGGVPVTFTVLQGGGNFDGQPAVTTLTDSDGRVSATLTLGVQEGNANNLVEANFPSNAGFAAAFTASGRAPGDPVNTTVTGVVLDNSNRPIPGVTIRAVLTTAVRSSLGAVQSATAVQTGTEGQFTIPDAPVGLVKLLVDGTTAQREGTYPSLEYDIVTVAGQRNDVGQPIYLLPLSAANQLCVTATTGGGTLTVPEAPGFSLTFGPGQVTFPGGSKSGCVSVTVVNGDKVPMVPGFGQQPRFIVTIQPAGAVFNPPAPITLPNVDGLNPREVTEMYSFDHDIGSFVAIGTGVVSDDGLVIRSSTGVGVLKAGWHCGGNPNPSGTAATCPTCRKCVGTHCVADLDQEAKACEDGNLCKACSGGNCLPIPLLSLEVEESFPIEVPQAPVEKINNALKKLATFGVNAEIKTTESFDAQLSTSECCNPKTGKGVQVTGSVSSEDFIEFEAKGKIWPPGPVVNFGPQTVNLGVASITAAAEFAGGVYLGLKGKIGGELGFKKDGCSDNPDDQNGCFFGEITTTLTPFLSAEVTASAELKIDCSLFCDEEIEVKAKGTLVAGQLSLPITISAIAYNKASCNAGLTGGSVEVGDGQFKISAEFSGSYSVGEGDPYEIEKSFDFLTCTITTSGVTCQ